MADQAPPTARYGGVAQAFNWLVVALIAMQAVLALVLPSLLADGGGASLAAWHFSVGSTVLVFMLLRLGWRLTHAPPGPPNNLSRPLQLLSRGTHWGMYGLLLLAPLLGWVAGNAFGASVRVAGFLPLPALVAENKALGEQVGALHQIVVFTFLALVALHLAGNAYHAWVKKDGVIRRMLPG